MKKRILITGCAGFIGSNLIQYIINNTDWEIVGIDSFRHRGDSVRVYQDPSRYTVFTHDLTTPISKRLISKIGHIDYIVNMASESHVDRSITDPVPFVENNVKLALTMLEYARKVKPEIFIQISTDEVYGAAINGHQHREWEPILPSNPYAASKAAQEAIATSYFRTYNLPIVITNTMNVFSQMQDEEKFIPMVIRNVIKGEEVTIHGKLGDIGSRFYIHADNKADALLFIIKNLKPTIYKDSADKVVMPDRYNIVGEREVDNLELAEMISKIVGKPLKYRLQDFHKTRPGHDRRYALNGDKLKSLGWIPPMQFEESLIKTVEWTLKHKEWLD